MRNISLLSCLLLIGCASIDSEFGSDVASDPVSTTAPTFLGLAPEVWRGTIDEHGIATFKGLPFAAAPVGDKRWQQPQPYIPKYRTSTTGTPDTGERDANSFAAACMQGPHTVNWYQDLIRSLGKNPELFPAPAQGYSEDCLYLNVWTPAEIPSSAAKPRRPVMVWIHGGSNKGGWSFEPDYHGANLARRDVVVVSIAYRLGIFGYFSHPELLNEQASASNYGLLDLIAALEWIREHIDAFGGDPNNVTVFGESAGAANIGYLMSAPAADGLFHRAAHQSAGYQLHHTPKLSAQTEAGVLLARKLNTDIAGLRALTGQSLVAAVEQHLPNIDYGPAIGGHALPFSPASQIATANKAEVPLLIGTNANEGLMYLDQDQTVAGTIGALGLSSADQVITQQLGDTSDAIKMDRLSSAPNMRCPSYEMASATVNSGASAWVYQFNRIRQGSHWQSVGAYHGAEIPYVFATHADWLETNSADRILTDVMQRYWVNFARTGNPNGLDLPRWQAWGAGRQALELDTGVAMFAAPDDWICELLRQYKP